MPLLAGGSDQRGQPASSLACILASVRDHDPLLPTPHASLWIPGLLHFRASGSCQHEGHGGQMQAIPWADIPPHTHGQVGIPGIPARPPVPNPQEAPKVHGGAHPKGSANSSFPPHSPQPQSPSSVASTSQEMGPGAHRIKQGMLCELPGISISLFHREKKWSRQGSTMGPIYALPEMWLHQTAQESTALNNSRGPFRQTYPQNGSTTLSQEV